MNHAKNRCHSPWTYNEHVAHHVSVPVTFPYETARLSRGEKKKGYIPLGPCFNFVKREQTDVQRDTSAKVNKLPGKGRILILYHTCVPILVFVLWEQVLHLIFKNMLGYIYIYT